MLELLRERGSPIAGDELGRTYGTSRQIVVLDIALLKAAGEPIIATARGYVYLPAMAPGRPVRTVVRVRHTAEQAAEELYALVDCGVRIVDVAIDHPLYRELRARLGLDTRAQVDAWLEAWRSRQARPLAELTNGVHEHTLEAPSASRISEAREVLRARGFLLEP